MPEDRLLTFCAGTRVVRDYYLAATVDEALAYLMSHQGDAQLVAGGTDLMPRVQRGEIEATCLVDISRIGALRRARLEDPYLVVGSGKTMSRIAQDPRIAQSAPLLRQAAERVAPAGISRLATLGGNLVSAQASSQFVVSMVVLDAQVEIANTTGSQWLPFRSTMVRAGRSRVDSTSELVTAARFAPLADGEGMAVDSLAPSADHYLPALTLALILDLESGGDTIAWCGCAYGTPTRLPERESEIEERLVGAEVDAPATVDGLAGLLVRELEDDDATDVDPGGVHDLVERVYACAVNMARRPGGTVLADTLPDA